MGTRFAKVLAWALATLAWFVGLAAPGNGRAADAQGAAQASGRKERSRNNQGGLPGPALWDVRALQEQFTVVSTRYDQSKRLIVWALEAKTEAEAARLTARFLDADFVTLAEEELQFAPALKSHHKGTRLEAVLRLPGKDVVQEANQAIVDRLK